MPKAEIKTKAELEIINTDEIPHILEPGEVGAVLELTVKDTKTGEIKEHRILKSKSFLRQFLDLWWLQAFPIDDKVTSPIRDTSNNLQYVAMHGYSFACNAGAGTSTYGIQVGTGNAAPTINDYKLQTQIAHGVGGGQLQYGGVTYGAPSSDATTSQFTITRDFANASGGGITVNEIGLAVLTTRYLLGNIYVLTIRDVIAGGILVPNGQTLTVNYRPQAVV